MNFGSRLIHLENHPILKYTNSISLIMDLISDLFPLAIPFANFTAKGTDETVSNTYGFIGQ